jgi:hypothetical protein
MVSSFDHRDTRKPPWWREASHEFWVVPQEWKAEGEDTDERSAYRTVPPPVITATMPLTLKRLSACTDIVTAEWRRWIRW